MSQGIFGLIDFNGDIESPNDLISKMGAFLQRDGNDIGKVSYVFDNHYILGMKRTNDGTTPYQQQEIAQSGDLEGFGMIHGEIHNYQNLIEECF